jgi:hypothetical protein
MSAKSKGPFGINTCQHKGIVLNNGAEIKQKHMHVAYFGYTTLQRNAMNVLSCQSVSMHLTARFTCCYLRSHHQTTHPTYSMDFPLIKYIKQSQPSTLHVATEAQGSDGI